MMKLNQLAIFLLSAALAGIAQQPGASTQPVQQPAAGAAAQQPAAGAAAQQPQQKKEIKDPAEYNAYVSAIGTADPNQKANALEQFITQYPNSVVKEDALEQLMAAYQQGNNPAKLNDAAARLMQINPNNMRGLLLMAYTKRGAAETPGNPNAAQDAAAARQYGERGLQALATQPKPEGMADSDYQKLKTQGAIIFNGAAGRGALQQKDYAAAQKYFLTSVQGVPDNLADVYPLAVSYLEPKPMNVVGLWWAARAVDLSKSNPASMAAISIYGKNKYVHYHGAEDGWDQLLAQAQNSPMPPPNFTVAPAPTPAEQVKKIAESKDPKQMDFGEWQLIFTYGDQPTVDRVWGAIKGVSLQFEAKVLQANKDQLMLAATQDAIDSNKPDVEVTMASPIPRTLMPKVGTDTIVQAAPVSYDKTPYLMHLNNGKLVVKAKKAPPAKRTTRRRRAAASQ
jgi:hypothetical protein